MGSIPARVIQVFISAIGLYFRIGSEIAGRNADSVSKDTFLLVQFKKFPNPSSKSKDNEWLSQSQVRNMYIGQAQLLEDQGRFREAEALYL